MKKFEDKNNAQVLDIIHACQDVIAFMEGLEKYHLEGDKKTRYAVIHRLQDIGEAAIQISHKSTILEEVYSEIEWNKVRGMRNSLAHGYNLVDLNIVWTVATIFVPKLLEALTKET